MKQEQFYEVVALCNGLEVNRVRELSVYNKRIEITEVVCGVKFEYDLLVELYLFESIEYGYNADICIKLFDMGIRKWATVGQYIRFEQFKHDKMAHSEFINIVVKLLSGNFREVING